MNLKKKNFYGFIPKCNRISQNLFRLYVYALILKCNEPSISSTNVTMTACDSCHYSVIFCWQHCLFWSLYETFILSHTRVAVHPMLSCTQSLICHTCQQLRNELSVSVSSSCFFLLCPQTGYARNHWGQELVITYLNAIKPSPHWYECGVKIP